MSHRKDLTDLFIGPLPEEAYNLVSDELRLFRQDRAVELGARALYGQKIARRALAEAEEHLERRRIDAKSGLLTADEWKEQVEKRIITIEYGQRAQDPDSAILLFFDAAGFGEINRQLGHTEGDRLIGIIASYLEQHARVSDGDILGRLGGDENGLFISFDSGKTNSLELLQSIEDRLQDFAPERYPGMPPLYWNHSFYRSGDCLGDMLARADVKGKNAKEVRRAHNQSREQNRRALELAVARD